MAVEAFLERRIRFTQIAEVIKTVLNLSNLCPANDLELLLSEDQLARQLAQTVVAKFH